MGNPSVITIFFYFLLFRVPFIPPRERERRKILHDRGKHKKKKKVLFFSGLFFTCFFFRLMRERREREKKTKVKKKKKKIVIDVIESPMRRAALQPGVSGRRISRLLT